MSAALPGGRVDELGHGSESQLGAAAVDELKGLVYRFAENQFVLDAAPVTKAAQGLLGRPAVGGKQRIGNGQVVKVSGLQRRKRRIRMTAEPVACAAAVVPVPAVACTAVVACAAVFTCTAAVPENQPARTVDKDAVLPADSRLGQQADMLGIGRKKHVVRLPR